MIHGVCGPSKELVLTKTVTPYFVTLLTCLTALMLGTTANAKAILKSNCYLQDQSTGDLQGVNVDESYPIASVSKIFTSYWAIKKMGVQGRFATRIHLAQVKGSTYDLHFEGVNDPYIGKWVLQFIATELNARGISKIRKMTFDESFKYINDPMGHISYAHLDNDEPSTKRVMRELRSGLKNFSGSYDALRIKAKSRRGLELPEKVSLTVEDIDFVPSEDFRGRSFDQVLVYRSAPLVEILKEMNRNSNNHAANRIFESLGGPTEFARFMTREGFHSEQVRFYNGSGDRKDFSGGRKAYNQATCRSVVQIIKSLCNQLRISGMGLQQILSVAGRVPPGQLSTVEMYRNEETEGALIAKTGTIDPAVTLAGLLSTDEGDVYFGYIYETEGGGDWRAARNQIRIAVTEMLQNFGGKDPIDYSAESFLAFDQLSKLTAGRGAEMP